MSDKFKLIKEFPLSPQLGTIVEFKTEKDYDDGIHDIGAIPTLFIEDCRDYPEFWNRVDDEYTIIKFEAYSTTWELYDIMDDNLYFIDSDNLSFGINNTNLENLISKDKGNKIISVRRDSDQEIFSIGDRVQYAIEGFWEEDSIGDIVGFEIIPKRLLIHTTDSKDWAYLSDSIRKVEILFTTEDEVDITNSEQDVYGVVTKANWQEQTFKAKRVIEKHDYPMSPDWKFFSTKEARKEYINDNKPKFSKNDMLDFAVYCQINNSFNIKPKINFFKDWLKIKEDD